MSGRRLGAGLVLAAACLAAADTGTAPPGFALADANGKQVRLSDYHGKVVLLDFWATWCHGCKTEIPWFMEFAKKYKRSGLAVIGVALDEDGWKSVRPFLKANRLNYPIVVGTEALAQRYGIDTMPVTLLIGRDGRIAAAHTGVVDRGALEGEIRALIERRGPRRIP